MNNYYNSFQMSLSMKHSLNYRVNITILVLQNLKNMLVNNLSNTLWYKCHPKETGLLNMINCNIDESNFYKGIVEHHMQGKYIHLYQYISNMMDGIHNIAMLLSLHSNGQGRLNNRN